VYRLSSFRSVYSRQLPVREKLIFPRVGDWFSIGVLLSGLELVAAAVMFVRARRQTRRRVESEGGTTATFWASAVYAAAVTSLVSFVPGSGVAGGAVAAYL
jgi:hypothetical protein